MVQIATQTANPSRYKNSTTRILMGLQVNLAQTEEANLANVNLANFSEVKPQQSAKIIDFVKLADRITNARYDDISDMLKNLEDQYAALTNVITLIPAKDAAAKSRLDVSTLRTDLDSLDTTMRTVQKDLQAVSQKRIKAMQETWHSPTSEVHPQILKPLETEIHQAEAAIKKARENAFKLSDKIRSKHAEVYAMAPAKVQQELIKPTPM